MSNNSPQEPPTMPKGNNAYGGSTSESDALGALVSLRGAPKTGAGASEMTPKEGQGPVPGQQQSQARMMPTGNTPNLSNHRFGGMDMAVADPRFMAGNSMTAYRAQYHGMAGTMPGMHPMAGVGGMNRAHEMAMMNQMMSARYADEARMMAGYNSMRSTQPHPTMGAMRGSMGGPTGLGAPHHPNMGAARTGGMMGGGYAPHAMPGGAPPPLSVRGGPQHHASYNMDMSAGGIARANMMAAEASRTRLEATTAGEASAAASQQDQQQSGQQSQSIPQQVHSPKNDQKQTTNEVKDSAKQAHPDNYIFPNPKKAKFPYKLYDMLMYSSKSEYKMGVSWTPDGRGFVIRDREALTEILPKFFSQTKYRSFTRQLNLWGFHRFTEDGWQHDNFVRGNIDDLKYVEYTKVKGGSKSDGPVKSKMIRMRMQQHYKEARMKGVIVNQVNPHEDGVVTTAEEEKARTLPPVVNKGAGGLVTI